MLLSDILIGFDIFEESILDSPTWFVDCLSEKDVWYFSDLENITGEKLYEFMNYSEKKYLGAMSILADRGMDICELEKYVNEHFYLFEDLNPDFSYYVLQD